MSRHGAIPREGLENWTSSTLSYLGKLSTSKETGVDRCSYQDIQGKESSDPSGKIQEFFLGGGNIWQFLKNEVGTKGEGMTLWGKGAA